jgi:hypothetical protein
MIIGSRAICRALALASLVPAAAAAQRPPQGSPFDDLFGRAPQRTGREYTSIKFRTQAGAQMGWILENEGGAPGDTIPEGLAGSGDASVNADYIRDRLRVQARGRYSYQEFRKEPAFGVPAYETGVGVIARPLTRLTFQGAANFVRSPFFQLVALGPDPASFQPIDRAAIILMQSDTIAGSAGVTSNYTSRSSLELTGTVQRTDFKFSSQSDFESVGGHLQWRRQMTRDLVVHAGYGRDQLRSLSADGQTVFNNDRVDIGVDYGRAFTFARRTSLSFGTETSLMRENSGPRHFRVNGHVTLDHRFRRTWQAQLSANRGTEFLPGFRAPVYTDYASATLDGFLRKRLLLNIRANAGQGQAGLSDPRKFISYSSSAKLTLALTRRLGVFGQYGYFHYQMPADPLTLFLVPRGARQALAIGVQAWMPIYDKDKVTRDPR